MSDRVRDRLHARGVRPGDRVGLYMRKSIDAVATLYGVLKAGAAYVPVDPAAPVARCAYILHNCGVAALVVDEAVAGALGADLALLGAPPRTLVVGNEEGPGAGLRHALGAAGAVPAAPSVQTGPDALAYILYTSGSTGKPKGVMLSQQNATSFVDWCS